MCVLPAYLDKHPNETLSYLLVHHYSCDIFVLLSVIAFHCLISYLHFSVLFQLCCFEAIFIVKAVVQMFVCVLPCNELASHCAQASRN